MKTIAVIVFCSALAGCAGPLALSMQSPEKLKTAEMGDLCGGWQVLHDQKLLNEIARRNQYSSLELSAIEDGHVYVGMREAAATCAWGTPSETHRTAIRGHAEEQWVYEHYLGQMVGSTYRFLYVEHQKIVAIQD